MAGVNIREAKKADAKKIYELMQQQASEQNNILPPHFTCEALAEGCWGSAAVAVAFVAERLGDKQGELEGYILANRVYHPYSGRAIFVKEIYVVPVARRSGVAMHLCRALLQAALSMGCMLCDVTVNKSNKAGVALLEKLGAKNLTKDEGWLFFSIDNKVLTELKATSEGQEQPQVRPAAPEDMATVMTLIEELAEHLKMSDTININANTLVNDYPPCGTFFECLVAESEGTLVGFLMFYPTFSSQGYGICFEFFYVRADQRGQGVGTALMAEAAQRGFTLGTSQGELIVLSWNTPAIAFYKRRGGTNLSAAMGLQLYHIDHSAMKKCAQIQ